MIDTDMLIDDGDVNDYYIWWLMRIVIMKMTGMLDDYANEDGCDMMIDR